MNSKNLENTPVIKLSDICYSYPGGPRVLKNLDLCLMPKDRIGILAPNGSGKTTLFHLIMGLLPPDEGTIEIFGKPAVTEKDFAEARKRIGLLFQDADDQLFCPTVIEDVAFGPLNMGMSRGEALETSRTTLSFLGLSEFEDRITYKLSGGEKKLVSLATVLAMSPEVLLLDEPLTGLDHDTRIKMFSVLRDLDLTHMVISHDLDFLTAVSNEVYTMKDGKIVPDEDIHLHRHEHAHILGHMPHKHKHQ
ncbi:MAG: energy-coupling factor ABC transporter ATP-binding protein [Desulfobacterales bacterium]